MERRTYIGPRISRPHVPPEKYCFKLKVVLKWRDIYIENKSSVTDSWS